MPAGLGPEQVVVDVSSALSTDGLTFSDEAELLVSQVTISPQTLTFTGSNWNLTQDVIVSAIDDDFVEPDSLRVDVSFSVRANDSAESYADVESASAEVEVIDADTAVFEWEVNYVQVEEGGAVRQLRIQPSKLPLLGSASTSFEAVATGAHPMYAIQEIQVREVGGTEWSFLNDMQF